ncbi:MAG: trypsin-like peptidase domain-containing protein [Candidatus Anammoxibacter sp.]
MANAKKGKVFCCSPYKKWVILLAVMIVGLVVFMVVGFDEDMADRNLHRIKEEGGGHHGLIHNTQMANLQNSYSDIAASVREITVNIEASRRVLGVAGNRGIDFADPWGVPHQQHPVAGNLNAQGVPKVLGVAKIRTAPALSPSAVMPHKYRGVCSNCHTILKAAGTNQVAALTPGRTSIGSGIIIDSKGFILTNYHVVADANNIVVTIANGNRYHADVKFTDVTGDLAILKINTVNKLPVAIMGDSDLVQEGDIVLAVGNPFGLSQTVTSGIISDTNRTVTIGGAPVAGLIQTDAAINRGSSGGPLVNIKGEVIGINSAIFSLTGDFTGIGFAIPVNRAKEAFGHIPSLTGIAANVFDLNIGEVITIAMVPNTPDAWFGAEVTTIDPIIAEQFGLHNNKGVLVNQVFPDSPAEKAGLVRGDVIKKINNRRINDMSKFRKIIVTLEVGDTIDVAVSRDNEPMLFAAQLENIPQKITKANANRRAVAAPVEMEWAGMEVMAVNPQLAQRFGIAKGTHGVVVVEPEGMPAAAGIVMGDIIIGINRKQINNMADFAETVRNVNVADGVLFDILRQGKPLYITM